MERPDDPSRVVYVSLPESSLNFLKSSDFTISAQVCEAVELLMKQRNYTVPVVPLPAGVKELPDVEGFAVLVGDFDKLAFLESANFDDADICVHLRCTRRYLAGIRKRELKEIKEGSRFENRPMGDPLEDFEVKGLLEILPGSSEAPMTKRCFYRRGGTNYGLMLAPLEKVVRGFLTGGLIISFGECWRRTAAGDAEVARVRAEEKQELAGAEEPPAPLVAQEVEL